MCIENASCSPKLSIFHTFQYKIVLLDTAGQLKSAAVKIYCASSIVQDLNLPRKFRGSHLVSLG